MIFRLDIGFDPRRQLLLLVERPARDRMHDAEGERRHDQEDRDGPEETTNDETDHVLLKSPLWFGPRPSIPPTRSEGDIFSCCYIPYRRGPYSLLCSSLRVPKGQHDPASNQRV